MQSHIIGMEFLQKHDLAYVVLILILFVIPRALNRFGIPLALGAFCMGAASNSLDLYTGEQVIPIFALLGIVSLFLYAGLEVDLSNMRANSNVLGGYVIIRVAILMLCSYLILKIFNIGFKPSALLALAVLTPSTGFILDFLPSASISELQKKWVKLIAIASEIVALAALLMIQSNSIQSAIASVLIIVIMTLILPFFFRKISTEAVSLVPGSEFSFFLLLAVVMGTITKKMGAYYLVGAFLVGISLNSFQKKHPSVGSEELIMSIRFFSIFFMPFYFFNAGLKMNLDFINTEALYVAAVLIIISLPLRIAPIVIHRYALLKESIRESLPIAISLLPTLVFGLVLVDILNSIPTVSTKITGGLLIYTICMTFFPPLILRNIFRNKDLAKIAGHDSVLEFKSRNKI